MKRIILFPLAILAFIQFSFCIFLSPPSLAQEWELRVKPRGTLRVVELYLPSQSVKSNYAEGLVTLDRDNNLMPCLAEDWRWLDDRTIEFKLRRGIFFHNGEEFDAETVRINWEEYRRMECPVPFRFLGFPEKTMFRKVDRYIVRFTLPEPDGLIFTKLLWFVQIAPAFFVDHEFEEKNWGYLPEAGPWGTGPFKIIKGKFRYGKPSRQLVLEANPDYWDSRYPKLRRLIFDNSLIGDRKEAMRLCREAEGAVDIVSYIRPLDTLKVAMSKFAKVVKKRSSALLCGIFNHRKKNSKWKDIRLRKAVNYAVNRKELWKYGAKGNAYNLGGLIPPGAMGHNPDLKLYDYDTEKARRLLKEAGYLSGFKLKINTPEGWKLESQIMSSMLKRIGLDVTFHVLTWPEWMGKVYIPILDTSPEEQDWDITIGHLVDWYGHTGASHLTYFYLEESDFRWIEYDEVYEDMWKDMAGTKDPVAQEAKIRQMVQYVYDRAYLLYIYSPLMLYAVNKEVNFVPQKRTRLYLKETSVTDNHWSVRGKKKSLPDDKS